METRAHAQRDGIQAYAQSPGVDSQSILDEILAYADELLADIGEIPPLPDFTLEEIGFWMAFYHYPAGAVYA